MPICDLSSVSRILVTSSYPVEGLLTPSSTNGGTMMLCSCTYSKSRPSASESVEKSGAKAEAGLGADAGMGSRVEEGYETRMGTATVEVAFRPPPGAIRLTGRSGQATDSHGWGYCVDMMRGERRAALGFGPAR